MRSLYLLSIALLLALPQNADAKKTDVLHYTIGGGPVISLPARKDHLKEVTLGVGWDMNLQCGLLDPSLTVQNQLNGVTKGFKNMMGNILNNATAAVMSYPGYLIQKEDPGLYDMLTNGVLQGKFDFDDGLTSCEGMVEEMGEMTADKSYNAIARAKAWTQAVKSGDAVRAKDKVMDDMGDSGITWIAGKSYGGRNQPPINPSKDAAEVGFDMLTEDQEKEQKLGLYQYWDSSEQMSEWLTSVIGTRAIQTGMDKSKTTSTAGVGLSRHVTQGSLQLEKELTEAIKTNTETKHYPQKLLEALSEGKVDNNVIARIASELSLSHNIEKALYARRALLTGKYEVNLAQHNLAQKDIDNAVTLLEKEINLLRFEAEVRQTIGSRTALSVVENYQYQRSQTVPQTTQAESVFLNETTPEPVE
ncbi:integrating conjugative element protein [Vibrio sp. MACH09]|uniref:integrating conjugative element protein n=1 Tax=Vibrio sp. MACH09 TaxID=3025122 RepID=UPI00278E0166|nr:integrating conjugative element protein [Vibrio sp. MACH09]GLO64077.1 integrating conjugative element protein [Vibrio sp. MACH09]